MRAPEIIITDRDSALLTQLIDTLRPAVRASVCALEQELERAHIVGTSEVPHDIVTMNSRVIFEDVDSGRRSEVVLVYPYEPVNPNRSEISVLAPVGSALLGVRAGESIEWRLPTGRTKRYRVLGVTYQPEAAGDVRS